MANQHTSARSIRAVRIFRAVRGSHYTLVFPWDKRRDSETGEQLTAMIRLCDTPFAANGLCEPFTGPFYNRTTSNHHLGRKVSFRSLNRDGLRVARETLAMYNRSASETT